MTSTIDRRLLSAVLSVGVGFTLVSCTSGGAPPATPGDVAAGTAPPVLSGSLSPDGSSTAPDAEPQEPSGTPDPLDSDQAWMWLISGEPEAVTYESLAAIKAASSAVVLGRIESVEPGPDFEDEYGNISRMATVIVEVENVLAGQIAEAKPRRMKLWTVVGWGDDDFPNLGGAELLDASLPRERAVLFVENVAEKMERMGVSPDSPRNDPEAYQILGGYGFVRDVDGVAEPPAWVESDWPAELRGRPFDQVIDEINRS